MWWLLLSCAPTDVRPGTFDVVAAHWVEPAGGCGFVAEGFPFGFADVILADAIEGTFTLALSTVSSDPLECRLGPIDDLGDPTYTCLSATFLWPVGEDRVAADWTIDGSYDQAHTLIGGELRIGATCASGTCAAPDGAPFATLPCSSLGFWRASRTSP